MSGSRPSWPSGSGLWGQLLVAWHSGQTARGLRTPRLTLGGGALADEPLCAVLSYCYDVADREIAASGIAYDSHQNQTLHDGDTEARLLCWGLGVLRCTDWLIPMGSPGQIE